MSEKIVLQFCPQVYGEGTWIVVGSYYSVLYKNVLAIYFQIKYVCNYVLMLFVHRSLWKGYLEAVDS